MPGGGGGVRSEVIDMSREIFFILMSNMELSVVVILLNVLLSFTKLALNFLYAGEGVW